MENEDYPDLTKSISQKYLYNFDERGGYPVEIKDTEYLNKNIIIPLAQRLDPLNDYISESKQKEWYNIYAEIQSFYSEMIECYNANLYRSEVMISLAGIFIEYLLKYEICRRNQADEDLINTIFYKNKYRLNNLLINVDDSDGLVFQKLPELNEVKKELISFVKVRNSYIHANLNLRNKEQRQYLTDLGNTTGYFLINGQKQLIQEMVAIFEYARDSDIVKEVSKKEFDENKSFLDSEDIYLTICLMFEVYKLVYKSRDLVKLYNVFLRINRPKPDESIQFLYHI